MKKELSFIRFFDEFDNIQPYHYGAIDQIMNSNKKFIVTKSVGMGRSWFYKFARKFLKNK